MKTINKKAFGTTCIITSVLFIFTIILFNITYRLNDDVMIKNLLSGGYTGTPEFMTYYFSVPLGLIISLLYKLVPIIPWFGIFFIVTYLFCFTTFTYRLLSIANNFTEKKILSITYIISISVLMYLTVFLSNTVLLHYTILAAIAGSTGLFLLITSKTTIFKDNLIAFILLLLCYLIRENVFYMLAPFFVVMLIYKFLSKEKISFLSLLLFVITFLVLFAVNKLAYTGEDWKSYVDYNDARTTLYDYVNIYTDDNAKEYYSSLGITEDTYDLYRSYNLMLEDSNIDLLNKFSSYDSVLSSNKNYFTRFKEAFYVYRHTFTDKQYQPIIYVILGLYFVLFCMYVDKKNSKQLITLLMLFLARSFMWMYLIWNNRYPERVTYSLMYIELLMLIGFFIEMAKLRKKLVLTNFIPMVTVLLLLYGASYSMQNFTNEYKELVQSNNNDDILFKYINEHPENVYFLDVFTAVNHTENAFTSNTNISNNMVLGGWMVESPLTDKRIKALGYDSVKDAITNGDNTYVVVKDPLYNGITIKNYEKWLSCDFTLIASLYNDIDEFLIYKVDK